MTAAGSGQERPAGGRQRHERKIEVEEILPSHLDCTDGEGRAFHVWTVAGSSKYGLGKLPEAQLRDLGRQIDHLLGSSAAGTAEGQGPCRLPGSTDGADAGD